MAHKNSESGFDSIADRDSDGDCVVIKLEDSSLMADALELNSQTTVNDDNSPRKTSKRSNRSLVWRYMARVEKTKALCKICNNIVPFYGGSTSNLQRHLEGRHQLQPQDLRAKPVPTVPAAPITVKSKPIKPVVDPSLYEAPPDNATKKSTRTNRSMVWHYMVRIDKSKSLCKICSSIIPYPGGSPSNLQRHLKTRHQLLVHGGPPTKTFQSDTSTPTPRDSKPFVGQSSGKARQKAATTKLLQMIASNVLPLSIVQNKEFSKFVKYLDPSYRMPSVHSITQRLDALKKSHANLLRADLNKVPAVALTADLWASGGTDCSGYLSVTASYINNSWELVNRTLSNHPIESEPSSNDVAVHLLSSATEWGLKSKAKVVVHKDEDGMEEVARQNGWIDVKCAADSLHLAIMDVLCIEVDSNGTLPSCVNKANLLVSFFLYNPVALAELANQQKQQGIIGDAGKPLKLIPAARTRWNSIYDMLKRLLQLRSPLVAVLSNNKIVDSAIAKKLNLSDEYWQLIADILPILDSLNAATEQLCADSVHVSVVFPLINKLLTNLYNDTSDNSAVRTFKEDMRCSLVTRFALDDVDTPTHPFAMATVLDPTTKKMELFDDDFRQVSYTIVSEVTASVCHRRLDSQQTGSGSLPLSQSENDLQPQVEFDDYLAEPVDDGIDPLRWWSLNETKYPNVAAVARRFLAVPANSLLSARRFSSAGRLQLDLRSRISSDYVDSLIFVHENGVG